MTVAEGWAEPNVLIRDDRTGVDEIERTVIRSKGCDPDNPAFEQALNRARWKPGQHARCRRTITARTFSARFTDGSATTQPPNNRKNVRVS